jgi:hypothetical protein
MVAQLGRVGSVEDVCDRHDVEESARIGLLLGAPLPGAGTARSASESNQVPVSPDRLYLHRGSMGTRSAVLPDVDRLDSGPRGQVEGETGPKYLAPRRDCVFR